MQKFMFSNGIIIAAAGITIGVATKEAITKILDILVMPVFNWMRSFTTIHSILMIPTVVIIFELLWTVLIWLVTIFGCFVLLEYFLNKTVFGLATTMPDDKKSDFVMSKVEAKTAPLISSSNEDLKQDKENVEKIVQLTTEEGVFDNKSAVAKIVKKQIVTEPFMENMYHILY